MRVISGSARGTKLTSIESDLTRPTLDRVKESVFNILQNKIKDKVALDLFAGSGALGIEALSRGALKAYFCDINKEAVKIIKQNLAKTHLEEKAIIINDDYKKALNKIKEKVDIVFLDPPYKLGEIGKTLELLKEHTNENSLIVIETDEIERDLKQLEGYTIIDKRKYGRVYILLIQT